MCCRTLQTVYSDADHPEEATRYGELADRYEERSTIPAIGAPAEEEHIFLDATPQSDQADAAVPEFSVDEAPVEASATHEVEAAEAPAPVVEAASPWPTAAEPAEEITVESADEPEFAVVDESAAASAEPEAASAEIDLSSEWDDTLTVEADEPAPAPAKVEVASASAGVEATESGKIDEAVEEIRFYIAHSMPEQAMAALAKLQTLTGDKAKIAELRAEVEAATQAAAEAEVPAAEEPVVEELVAEDIPSMEVEVEEEAPVAVEEAVAEEPVAVEPEAPVVEELPIVAEIPVEIEPEPEPVAAAPAPPVSVKKHQPAPVAPEPEAEPEPEPGVLKEFVSDLESSLGDGFLPGTVTKPAAAPVVVKPEAPAVTKPAASPRMLPLHTPSQSSLPRNLPRFWESLSPTSRHLSEKIS